MIPSRDLAILRHRTRRTQSSVADIAAAYWMTLGEVRARLVLLESMRLVVSRSDPEASPSYPRRVYVTTGEGRRKAGAQSFAVDNAVGQYRYASED